MSAILRRLFPNRQTLLDADAPPPPTTEITELDGRVRRLAHLARMCPYAPGFRIQSKPFIDRYGLTQECSQRFGHNGGQRRIADALVPNKPLHHLLRAATPLELRKASMSGHTGLWVFRDDVEVKKQFGTSLWEPTTGGRSMRLATTRCFVSGTVGDSSTIYRHHYHKYCQDILCAPLRQDANNLIAGLVASGGDFSQVPLHTRLDLLRDMCLAMNSIQANPSTTTYPSIKATGGEHGSNALFRALGSRYGADDLAHLLTTRVPSDLRAKAGLKSRDKALMFTSSALQIMPFVFPQTVFQLIETTVAYGHGSSHVESSLKLVYGRCPITGVGGKKTDDNNWPVVLHHITVDGRHYLVGFINNMINAGLGALGNYKSK